MKKQLSVIIGALAILSANDASAATNWGTRAGSSADLSGAPATRTRENINYKKYKTNSSTYKSTNSGDLYYVQPSDRSALYKQYNGANSSSASETKTTIYKTRSETVRTTAKRKYFLAHPFFQPLGGKFGSITDLSYMNNSYDFTINQTIPLYDENGVAFSSMSGLTASWDANVVSVKEDFSFGISERVAVLGMIQYQSSDYETTYSDGSPSDKMDNNDINMYGLGLQWRFVDNDQWIAMASGYFQHQKDTSNNILLEAKAGHKIQQSTIYGLGRFWHIDLENDLYGNTIYGRDGYGNLSMFFLPYGSSSPTYIEGGLGVFSVLNKDWTLNVEATFGNYDWHNQASVRAAIGWQPNDWFALNLYAKTSIYDDANDKNLDLYYQNPMVYIDNGSGTNVPLTALAPIGNANLDKYSEMNIGLQMIFQF